MRNLTTLMPRGLPRFAVGRLLRAFVSLVLFQVILFALIQALPKSHAAISERDALRQATSQSSREEDTTSEQADSPAQAEQSQLPAGNDEATDQFSHLRDAGNPLMNALLDEAAILEKAVVLSEPSPRQDSSPRQESSLSEESAQQESLASDEGALPPEQKAPLTYEAGLTALRPPNESVWQQLLNWMLRFFRGDLGESAVRGGGPVKDILAKRLPTTLMVFLPGTVLGFLLGLWLGKRIVWRRRGWVDLTATLGGAAFYTSFPPWLAFVLVAIFAVNLRWFPVEKLRNPIDWVGVDLVFNEMLMKMLLTFGLATIAYLLVVRWTRHQRRSRTQSHALGGAIILILAAVPWIVSGQWRLVLDILHHLALPLATLIMLSFGETMLIMRATMAQTMEEDHVAQVRAMGISDSRIRDRHVARVAILPVLTRFVVHLPFVITGSFFLEHAFAMDGMGKRLVEAANQVDLPVMMGILSVVGIGILLTHVIFDILTVWLDPRLRTATYSGAT